MEGPPQSKRIFSARARESRHSTTDGRSMEIYHPYSRLQTFPLPILTSFAPSIFRNPQPDSFRSSAGDCVDVAPGTTFTSSAYTTPFRDSPTTMWTCSSPQSDESLTKSGPATPAWRKNDTSTNVESCVGFSSAWTTAMGVNFKPYQARCETEIDESGHGIREDDVDSCIYQPGTEWNIDFLTLMDGMAVKDDD